MLDAAAECIKERGWTGGSAFALGDQGEVRCALDPEATRYSVAGAVAAVALERVAVSAMTAIHNCLRARGHCGSVASWEQTHDLDDVLELLQDARNYIAKGKKYR